jgi:hypothetical protein
MTRIPMMRASAIALLVYVAIMFGFLGGGAVHATPHQRSASSDSLTLSITNGSSFEYNGAITPHFIGTVSLASPLQNVSMSGQIIISNGEIIQFTGFVTSPDGLTINENTDNGSYTTTGAPISIGDFTAYATFHYSNSVTNISGSLQSLPIQFSITKDRFNLSCNSTDFRRIIKPGVPAQFQFTADNSNQSVPLDWTQGLASITFLGPSTTTTSNIQPDSSGMFTVTAPPAVGHYNMTCTFSGTTYYAPESVTWSTYPVLVSDMSPLGGVQVYSNPSSIASNQPVQLYIVFKAAPGLPTPSGQFNIQIGSGYGFYYTNSLTIRADGTAMVSLSSMSHVDSNWPLSVNYDGDGYYNYQTLVFTLTNPPIPGNGGGSGGSGTSGTRPTSPKATVTPKPTATVAQTATAGANSTTSSGTQPATPSASDGSHVGVFSVFGPAAGVALWIVIILCVALAGGVGYGVFYWLSYRTRIASAPIGQADTTADASSPWNASSLDE